MYPFVRPHYKGMSIDQKKELCSSSYRICTALKSWTPNNKQTALSMISDAMSIHSFIKRDIGDVCIEMETYNPLRKIPFSLIHIVTAYFQQFYVIRDQKLYLPIEAQQLEDEPKKPTVTESSASTSKPKIRAITEEVWWVVRVKNDYRMCRLTFDRGEYWEMVEYVGTKVHNAQYRFPKYDNRIVYEFKEHITPDMFSDKISEAISARRTALQKQANVLLEQYETVLIARHPNKGTLVGGVVKDDDMFWYLDTYDEHGEHIFYEDTMWKLEKKSRCTVVQILRRK